MNAQRFHEFAKSPDKGRLSETPIGTFIHKPPTRPTFWPLSGEDFVDNCSIVANALSFCVGESSRFFETLFSLLASTEIRHPVFPPLLFPRCTWYTHAKCKSYQATVHLSPFSVQKRGDATHLYCNHPMGIMETTNQRKGTALFSVAENFLKTRKNGLQGESFFQSKRWIGRRENHVFSNRIRGKGSKKDR